MVPPGGGAAGPGGGPGEFTRCGRAQDLQDSFKTLRGSRFPRSMAHSAPLGGAARGSAQRQNLLKL